MLVRIILTHEALRVSFIISFLSLSTSVENSISSIALKELDNDISHFKEESKIDNIVGCYAIHTFNICFIDKSLWRINKEGV